MPSHGNDVRVSTWSELQSRLYEDSWQPNLKRFRSPFAFRGLSNAAYIPESTLTRMGGDYGRREQSLLRNFRKYAHRNATQRDSLWNWIALAQHHELPTRLLDWSFSPLVALHFPTVNRALGEARGFRCRDAETTTSKPTVAADETRPAWRTLQNWCVNMALPRNVGA